MLKLRQGAVLGAANQFINLLDTLASMDQDTPVPAPYNQSETRKFLLAWMITYRQSNLMVGNGELQIDLFASASALVRFIEMIVGRLVSDEPLSNMPTYHFPSLIDDFFTKFDAWKAVDEIDLVNHYKHTLRALYTQEEAIHLIESFNPQIRAELIGHIVSVRSSFSQVRGRQELAEFDAELTAEGFTNHLVLGV